MTEGRATTGPVTPDATTEWVKTNDRDMADGVLCICGNQTHVDGFYPCDETQFVSPDANGPWNGDTCACLSCGRVISFKSPHARPLPTNLKWDWTWEHPVVGRIEVGPGTTIPD